jgi:hypothetical protein
MATASMYVARRCGDEDAAAAEGAGTAGVPGVAGVVAVNVVFGDVVFADVVFGDADDDFVDFAFKVWRSFAKARRK